MRAPRRRAARRRRAAGPGRDARTARRAGSPAGTTPTDATSSSTAGSGRTSPATTARSIAIARRSPAISSSRSSGVAQIAAIRSDRPLVADGVGLGEQRAGAQQPVGQRLERRAALAAQLEPAQRPGELARLRRPARDERAERAQLVLLLGRQQAVAGAAGAARWRAGSPATASRRCAPTRSGRARARPRPTAAARSAAGAAAGRPARAPASCSERQHRDGRELVAAQLRRASWSVDAADERHALAERDLVGVDHEPLDGRDDDGQRARRCTRPPRAPRRRRRSARRRR